MNEIINFLETNYSIDAISYLLQTRIESFGNKQEQQKHIVKKITSQVKLKIPNAKEIDIEKAIFKTFDFLDYNY